MKALVKVGTMLLLLSVGTSAWATYQFDANKHIWIKTVNQAKYQYDASYFGFNPLDPDYNYVYWIQADGGGLNQMHITTNPASPYGQNTSVDTNDGSASGDIYITTTGGRGYNDDIILAVSVKPVDDALPANMGLDLTVSGWEFTPPPLNTWPTDAVYTANLWSGSYGSDFIYKSEKVSGTYVEPVYKPGPGTAWALPFYSGYSGPEYVMFVDLKVGNLYQSDGYVKVHYSFTGMTTHASFNAYGWCRYSNQGQGINWTQNSTGTGSSGYAVNYTP